jgi:hypothetical protein
MMHSVHAPSSRGIHRLVYVHIQELSFTLEVHWISPLVYYCPWCSGDWCPCASPWISITRWSRISSVRAQTPRAR